MQLFIGWKETFIEDFRSAKSVSMFKHLNFLTSHCDSRQICNLTHHVIVIICRALFRKPVDAGHTRQNLNPFLHHAY